MDNLQGKVIFITGASRGIGREIALRCAKDGAKIVIAAKTASPHPTLEGTIFTVAEEVIAAGGQALPLAVDVRSEESISQAITKTVTEFGGIDILINNASAINLSSTLDTTMKRFDLMFQVNMRATFLCAKLALPYLTKAKNPHILTMSPPLNMQAKWFKDHLAYTMSKYGMSMCTLGMAEEFKRNGIAVNSLWPKTIIATAAIAVNFPPELLKAARKPSIVADAAYQILTSNSKEDTGNFYVDEEVLIKHGATNLDAYACEPSATLYPDFFIN